MTLRTTHAHKLSPYSFQERSHHRKIEHGHILMQALLSSHPLKPQTIQALSHPLVIKLALSEGLGGALYHLLNAHPVISISEQAHTRLLQAHLKGVWLEESRLRALFEHWPKELPVPMLIKGASYTTRVAGQDAIWHEAERACSDLDLLIPVSAKHAQPQLAPFIQAQTKVKRSQTQVCTPLSLNDLLIECHHHLAHPIIWSNEGILSAQAMWNRAKNISLPMSGIHQGNHLQVKIPHPLDQLIIALVQLLKGGGGARIRDWIDLTKLLLKCSAQIIQHQASEVWQNSGLTQTFSYALTQLNMTPAGPILSANLPTMNLSTYTTTLPHFTHPLSGITPNRLERMYTRFYLMSTRPSS